MTSPLPVRPTLIPGLPILWRDRHTVQLGLDPTHSTVLDLAHPVLAEVLPLLDGEHTEPALLRKAAQWGIPDPHTRALVHTLRQAGLLLPRDELYPARSSTATRRRLTHEAGHLALHTSGATPAARLRLRHNARITITGAGRIAAPLTVALADSGIGHLHAAIDGVVTPTDLALGILTGADLGSPRRAAIAAAARRAAPDVSTASIAAGQAHLVVHLGLDRPTGLIALGHARRRRPHLLIAVRDATIAVGPLVPPSGGPCLRCVELHRSDRDPDWPELARQLPDHGPEGSSAASLLAATAYACEQILAFVEGDRCGLIGTSTTFGHRGGPYRRRWPGHPRCSCGVGGQPPAKLVGQPTPTGATVTSGCQ